MLIIEAVGCTDFDTLCLTVLPYLKEHNELVTDDKKLYDFTNEKLGRVIYTNSITSMKYYTRLKKYDLLIITNPKTISSPIWKEFIEGCEIVSLES